jgi:hypothetical protein
MDFLNNREGVMDFYQVFLLETWKVLKMYKNRSQSHERTISLKFLGIILRVLKKYKSQGKTVEVTVNSM